MTKTSQRVTNAAAESLLVKLFPPNSAPRNFRRKKRIRKAQRVHEQKMISEKPKFLAS